MPRYNTRFELSIDDLDLIETALRHKGRILAGGDSTADTWGPERDERMRRTHDLLGRLHNQKTFYRPRRKGYVGG